MGPHVYARTRRVAARHATASLALWMLVMCCLVVMVDAQFGVGRDVEEGSRAAPARDAQCWEVHALDTESAALFVMNLSEARCADVTDRARRVDAYGPVVSTGVLREWRNETGWDLLHGTLADDFYLHAWNGSASDDDADANSARAIHGVCVDESAVDLAYHAMGIGEGYLTQEALFFHLQNTLGGQGGLAELVNEFAEQIYDWFDRQSCFLREHFTPARLSPETDHSDRHARQQNDEEARRQHYSNLVYRLTRQLDGVLDGYNTAARHKRAGYSSSATTPVRVSVDASAVFSCGSNSSKSSKTGRFSVAAPAAVTDEIDKLLLLLLNMQGEMPDIIRGILYDQIKQTDAHHNESRGALSAEAQYTLEATLRDLEERYPEWMVADHCSALVKVMEEDDDDIVVAHTTWNAFQSMTRMHKNYALELYASLGLPSCPTPTPTPTPETSSAAWPVNTSELAHRRVSMSSYPGLIHSIDDFYQTQARLTVTETSYSLVDQRAYGFLTPDCVPAFLRVMIANYLTGDVPALSENAMPYSPAAASASSKPAVDWFQWFGRYNSGTYNNEWMVLVTTTAATATAADTFLVGESVPAGALEAEGPVNRTPARSGERGVRYENMPSGLVVYDMTRPLFEVGYWASYNIPAFDDIDRVTGTGLLRDTCGAMYDHDAAPRARAFHDAVATVRTEADLVRVMRWGPFRIDANAEIPNCTGAGAASNAERASREATAGHDACDPPYSSFLTIAARGDLNPPGGQERYGPCHARLGRRNHAATDLKMSRQRRWRDPTRVNDPHSHQPTAPGASCEQEMWILNGPPHADDWMEPGTPRAMAEALRRDYPPFHWRQGLFDPEPPRSGLPTTPYTFQPFVVATRCNPTHAPADSDSTDHTGIAGISAFGAVAVIVLVAAVACVVVYVLRQRATAMAHRLVTPEEARLLRGDHPNSV